MRKGDLKVARSGMESGASKQGNKPTMEVHIRSTEVGVSRADLCYRGRCLQDACGWRWVLETGSPRA